MKKLSYTDGKGTHIDIVLTKHYLEAKIRETGERAIIRFTPKLHTDRDREAPTGAGQK